MARFFDSVLAGASVAPSGAFLVVSAALVAGAAGAVAGDVVSAASTGAASRPMASRDAAIRFIVREPPGAAPTRHGTEGLRRRLPPGESLDAVAALGEECARPGVSALMET